MSPRASLPLFGAPPETRTPGAAVFAKGFRPFFLLGAMSATLFVPLWMLTLFAGARPAPYLDPVTWHAHEMVFGYGAAIVAGFLLTAVSNWTGRETAVGRPLAALVALWLAGRGVLLIPGLPSALVALVDALFLPAVAVVVARPLVATNNKKNLVMVAALFIYAAANISVHLDALGVLSGARRRGVIVGVDLLVLLIAIIAGRVFPMFTKNATGDASIRSQPRLDAAAVLALVAILILDAVGSDGMVLSVVGVLAAALSIARATTWGTRRSVRDPMLWILHVGYAWIPVGLLLRVAAAVTPLVPPAIALHALTAGAIGSVTLGMMARVALGHTGRRIAASRRAVIAFVLLQAAASARVVGPLLFPRAPATTLIVSAALWAIAFALYLMGYTAILLRPRDDGKAG